MNAVDTGFRVATLAERPDLEPALVAMESTWPNYIQPDPLLVYWVFDRYPQHQLVVIDDEDQVIARAASIPLAWSGAVDELPDTGWDAVLRQCLSDTYRGQRLNTLCALEIAVVPGHKARNLSGHTLSALTSHARACGFGNVIGPVRPSRKHEEPAIPLADYVHRTRSDGLPEDPWLRVHVRAGGDIVKVCPASMTVSGSLAQWRGWTGLPFASSGPTEVPGALVPVSVDVENDYAVYVEPNVWVRHCLTPSVI
ncbi:N-acetyltransferase [Streptomyces sp. NPDC057889]|uniref:N-acetyltransferase n=1 Tax=unclassified Streptomyces TaxID=2593676 RepID=UPI0036744FEA